VYFNLSAACLSRFTAFPGFLKSKAERENAEKYVKKLNIKTPSIFQPVRYLSGGNQQKVAVGKWLASDCEMYIFDEPTKGVDVGAKQDIFHLIQDIAKQGKCVLYATSETNEILSITDRTYVMYNGRIAKELVTAKTSEDEIMYYSTGGK
jgi:simple sugar transport system ATP-binding protein